MRDLEKAKNLLLEQGYTCVMCRGETVCTSVLRGVKPLVIWLESGQDFCGFAAADKVVGRATAFLYALMGVTEVYAKVISRPALQVLKEQGISVEYGELAEHIINRSGDGICPFESEVLSVEDPQNAYSVIRKTMEAYHITLDEKYERN